MFIEDDLPTPKKRKNDEFKLQCQIIHLLRMCGFEVWATPNGGSRNRFEAYNFKRSGVKSGVSDLIVLLKGKTVFVELKTPTGRQSITQQQFQKVVESKGHLYLIWRSIEDCQNFINKYKDIK